MAQTSKNGGLRASNERILEETRLKLALARQHLEALQEFGLSATWLDELEQEANQAEETTTLIEQRERIKSLTTAKEEALEACGQWGRKLRLRMDLAFVDRPREGMMFPAKEFRDAEHNESRMIALLPSLMRLAQEHSEALTGAGQTAADLEAGEQLLQRLKATNEAQEEFKYTSPTVTGQRRDIYRNLYEKVQRINQVGQMVFGTDTAQGRMFTSRWTQEGGGPSPEVTPEENINPAP